MKVDYIVVGSGLAGILFCEELRQHNKTFIVIDNNSQKASVVAGGLYNPIILKRFTPVWKSQEQLELALPKYKVLENYLSVKLDYKLPVYRLLASIQEQNNWFNACDNIKLSKYLKPKIIANKNPSIKGQFGFGEVLETGRIDTSTLINAFREKLSSLNRIKNESFQYNALKISNSINYNDIEAKHIVFAEGFGLKQNPFFKYLPLNGTKGELLIIKAPDLNIDVVIKSAAFIIPLQEHKYIVGATYEWTDKTNLPTKKAREELITKLKSFITCDFEIIDQIAAIRPTVKDRRPLVGTHSDYKNLHVLNGLGTRGVMIAPYAAKQLYNYIENHANLNPEIDINRFSEML